MTLTKPTPSFLPDLTFENQFGHAQGQIVAGVDEVGRGPLAGPVVACAVVLPAIALPAGVTDSKKLSAKARDRLNAELRQLCTFGLGQASVAEIDEINILNATFLAMERALADLCFKLGRLPDHVLVDGNRLPKKLPCPGTAIVGGDARSLSIAAASIIAKVERDTLMQQLAREYPGYGWETNAGYGSATHMNGLAQLGATPHHRRSFAPVAARLQQQAEESEPVS